ncbi:hypothetical protein V7S43_009797 [Phytophthora oleae]|uniref:Uncharacterized protein n=1 Tax=Phytophthora oleae TaxID=2107226 RepID=A0ABD3FEH5_9STRA
MIDDHFVEHVDDNNSGYDKAIDAEQENIRGYADALRVACESDDEVNVLERRVGLTDESTPAMASQTFSNAASETKSNKEPVFKMIFMRACFRICFRLEEGILVIAGEKLCL